MFLANIADNKEWRAFYSTPQAIENSSDRKGIIAELTHFRHC